MFSVQPRSPVQVVCAGLALAGLLAGTAACSDDAEAPPSPSRPEAEAGPSSGAADEMVAAAAKSLGITVEQARDRLAQQGRMIELNTAVSATLDDSWSAGTWLDKDSGKLTVAVTSQARADEVRRRNAEPRLVERSGQELERLQTAANELMLRMSVASAGTYIDVTKNVVVVDGQRTDLPEQVVSRLRDELGAGVEVRFTEAREEFTDLRSGDRIVGFVGTRGSICSLGWLVSRGNARFIMTAAHCINQQPKGIAWTHEADRLQVGRTDVFRFARNSADTTRRGSDWGLIRLNNGVAARYATSIVSSDSVRTISRTLPPEAVPVGTLVFKRGQTTALTSGRILARGRTSLVGEAPNRLAVDGLVLTSLVADSGDSGGPFFTDDPARRGSVIALGVTSTSRGGAVAGGDQTSYVPLTTALAQSGTSLVVDPNPR